MARRCQAGYEPLLSGYAKAESGESIRYHRSLYPDAYEVTAGPCPGRQEHSLANRRHSGRQRSQIPYLCLAGGHRINEGAHTFTLRVNGELSGSPSRPRWMGRKRTGNGRGHNGAELLFQAQLRDEYADLFGHMYLRVPPRTVPSGAPVVIEVQGDSAGSADWL